MIHLWTVEGDDLVLNVSEILKYRELAIIYKRDDSDNKAFAKKEFRYIDLLSNREGYCIINGLTKTKSHNHAIVTANLHKDYKPDPAVRIAIDKVYNDLNGGVIEKLIDSTVRSLSVSADVVVKISDRAEELIEKEALGKDDTAELLTLLDKISLIAKDIPAKVDRLATLKHEYNVKVKGAIITRGGREYIDSLDGGGEVESSSDDELLEVE